MTWLEQVIEKGKCGICEGSLKESKVNLVNLDKIATWEYPSWGNILAKDPAKRGNRASAVVCNNCVNEETGAVTGEVKFALESKSLGLGLAEFVYHKVEDLEDAPKISEEDLRYPF